jgi:hypothetical protein
MKHLGLIITFVGMSVATAHAGVVTLEEHSTGDTPTIDLSTILGLWGTPGDPVTSGGATSDTFFYTSGPNDVGTNDIAGLNIINDTGMTITSLQVYAYGSVSGGSFQYNCGVNNFFSGCTPTSPYVSVSNGTVPITSPLEWNFSGLGGSDAGIAPGTEFRLTDSVDALSGTGSALFYEIEINGTPFDPPSPVPEPTATPFLAGGGILMGFLLRRQLIRAS